MDVCLVNGPSSLAHGKHVDARLSKWKRLIRESSFTLLVLKWYDAKKRPFFHVSQDEGSKTARQTMQFLPGTTDKLIVETMRWLSYSLLPLNAISHCIC